MKNLLLGVFCLLVLSVFATAQNDKAVRAAGNSESNLSIEGGMTVEGQLLNTLDAKKARVGDKVVLKTTKAVKENGQTIIPRGSKLIGQVIEVQKWEKGGGGSKLALFFDRLEGGRLTGAINAQLVSITNISAAAQRSGASEDIFSSSTASGSASASSRGGLLGGGLPAGGLLGSTASAVTSTVGAASNAGGNIVRTTTETTAGNVVTGAVGGLQISNSANGSANSGFTINTAGRDVKIEKGASMKLQLMSTTRGQ
jgi:hypothetical protein